MTTGQTLEETQRNIREAIESHIETLRQFGDFVPAPSSRVAKVEITAA